jgi:hypothetical protein
MIDGVFFIQPASKSGSRIGAGLEGYSKILKLFHSLFLLRPHRFHPLSCSFALFR